MLLYSCLKFDCRVVPISCQNLICYGGSRFLPTNIHVCYFTKFLFLLFALQPMPSFYDMFHHHQHVVICAKFVSTEHGNTEFSFFPVYGSVKKLCVSAWGVFRTTCMVYFTEVLVCFNATGLSSKIVLHLLFLEISEYFFLTLLWSDYYNLIPSDLPTFWFDWFYHLLW